jgi:Xaa-Pro aminopeptidase
MNQHYPYHYPGYPAGFKSSWKFPMPSEKERDRRWHTIRKIMHKYQLDCLLISAPWGHMPTCVNHIYYVSNYVPFFNHGTYIVFPLEGQPLLTVSNAIGPQFLHCASETSWIKDIVESIDPVNEIIKKIEHLKLEKGKLGLVAYNMGVFPACAKDILHEKLPLMLFEDATKAISEAMDEVSRTSEEELAFLRKTCEIQDISLQAVAKAFKPGVTEKELWAAAEEAIIENGGWYPHFMLVTSGQGPIFPRAPASHAKLDKGDIVMFETNVVYGGISSQICYAMSLGKPEKQIGEMYDFCKELYQFALEELDKKNQFGEIETGLINRIHKAGYEPMTPQIHVYNASYKMPTESPPQAGDYFTVHPNFCNRNYTCGAKFGDTVRITTEGKVERLQKTPARLHIVSI